MFEYKITVTKLGVDFIAKKGNVRHEQFKEHSEAPRAIRAIYSKMCESKEEEEFLYQATKMFQAKEITTTLA